MPPPSELRPLVLVLTGSDAVTHDLRLLLEPAGFEVRADLDGTVPGVSPDVVVVDVDRIRSLAPELRVLPALAVIRRDEAGDVAAAFDAGACDVLPLPLMPAETRGRVAATARLSAAEAGLRSRNAVLVAWAARASHDLMSALAVISGVAETLEAAWDRLPEADRARLLASIRNQVSRVTAMLDEVFTVARSRPEETGVEESPAGG